MCYLIIFVILDFDHHLQKSWHPVITVTPPTPRKQLLLHLPLTQGFFPLFRKDLRGQCLLASVWVGRCVCVCVCRCIGHPLGVCARASECALLWVDFFSFLKCTRMHVQWDKSDSVDFSTHVKDYWMKETHLPLLSLQSRPHSPLPFPSLIPFFSWTGITSRHLSLSVAVGSFTYKWSC